MAGGGEEEAATAFVKTSLGTHIAISFPASTTTVAHLKRIVSEEHAAAFPHIAAITVDSFKVRRRGSWYHLSDSMAVRAAFHGIKGAWHLYAHALLPHSAAPPSYSNVGVLCSQKNAIGDAAASPSSGMPSTDQEDEHDHHLGGALTAHVTAGENSELGDDVAYKDDASALTPPRATGTSLNKCSTVEGENSDPHVPADGDGYSPVRAQQQRAGVLEEEPRGRKRSREKEDGHHDQSVLADCVAPGGPLAALVCPVRQDDQDKGRHNSMPKRICVAREDGLSSQVHANAVRGSDDVIVLSSDDEMLEDDETGALDNSFCQDEGLNFLESSVVELGDDETKSMANDQGSNSENPALCFSLNKNDSEKHAAEGMAQEKLVEQQDHLHSGQESNYENPGPSFSANKNDSTTATEEHADQGMAQEKLIEQQDYFNNGEESSSEDPALCFSVNKNDSTIATEKHADQGMAQEKLIDQQDHLDASDAEGLYKYSGTEVLQNCNSKDTTAIHSEQVSDCHQYEGSSMSFDLKCCSESKCEILTDQAADHDHVCSEAEVTPIERAHLEKQNDHGSDPLLHDLAECARSYEERPICGQKEPCIAEVCHSASSKKGKDLPPCVETLKEVNPSEKEAASSKVKGKEPWTAKVCNGERSSKGTDHPPCVETLKEGNSLEKEGVAQDEQKQSTRTVTLVDVDGTEWTMQLDDSDCPPCAKSTKEGSSSEKEEMTHKVKEEEPWTARVCNGERNSSNGTDHPPCAGSMREGNSSEKDRVSPNGEKQSTRTVTLVDVDGTKWTMQLDDSFDLGPQESSTSSDAEESYSHSAKLRQNAEERPEEGTPENGGTRVPTERSDLRRHGSFKTPTSSGPTRSKDVEGTSADGAEQGAWDGRRGPRHVVRKIPNSRAAKMYGYR